ncbi:MAG: CDP-glycerol glycerophosphotransferase family protein [Arthrobacter sp.]
MAGALLPSFLRRTLLPKGRRQKSTEAGKPLLSLILVPGDTAAEPEAVRTLLSLLAQSNEALEIIVAGAHASAPAVRELVEADPRVTLMGPASTLSEACRLATGDAVALIEPGAEVPEGYYASLLPALLASSAAFVSGLHPRPRGTAAKQAAHLGAAWRTELSLSSLPSAFADTALWPKLSTRSFVQSVLDALPGEPETQRTAATMMLAASSFGYVPVSGAEPVQDEKDEQPADLLHRLAASWRQLETELAAAPDDASSCWFAESFGTRWPLLAREVPRQDSAYWKSLCETAAALVATPSSLSRFNVHDRVLAVLAAADRLEDFRTVLAETQDGGRGYRVQAENGELVARPAYLHLLGCEVPQNMLVLSAADFPVRSRLRTFQWEKAGLRIGGFAYVPGIGGEHTPCVRVFLADPETGNRIAVETEPVYSTAINETTGDRWNDYSSAGFTALIGQETLNTVAAAKSATWFVELEVAYHGRTSCERLTKRDGDFVPSRLPLGAAADAQRVIAQFDQVQGLRLRTVSYRYLAAHPGTDGHNLVVAFVGEVPSRVVLEAPDRPVLELQPMPGQSTAFFLPLAEAAAAIGGDVAYQLKAGGAGGSLVPVGAAEGSATLEDISGEIRSAITGFGYLTLGISERRIEVTGWSLSGDVVTLRLAGPGTRDLSPASLWFEGPAGIWSAGSVEPADGGTVRALFPLDYDPWGSGGALRAFGRYRLKTRGPGDTDIRVVAAAPALAGTAAEASHPRLRVRTSALAAGEPFQLRIDSPLSELERGAHNQQRFIEQYRGTTDPLVDAVFFESFGGTSATDSVLAICDALAVLKPDLRRYWSVADPSVAIPAGAVPLHRYTAEWYRVLGTSKYLVNNNTFPVFFRKKPGQIYLQTWHGTPLKRIGFDTPVQRLTPSYLRTLAREPSEWDALLAQSPAAAQLLAGAFRYQGQVPVLGYPRNDALAADTAAAERKRVREVLQIPDEQTIVLYAPTWRDTERTRGDRHAVVNYLDAGLAEAALGSNYTILFRGHHNVAGQRSVTGINGLVDVTDYPQISDLCLAADLLVTDYSSIMFDYAVTGKPMLFLVPDLDEYRDNTRGFYFDLQEHAPGPLAYSAAELFEQILSYQAEEWRTAYNAFVSKFAPYDDGSAARRIIEQIWN